MTGRERYWFRRAVVRERRRQKTRRPYFLTFTVPQLRARGRVVAIPGARVALVNS